MRTDQKTVDDAKCDRTSVQTKGRRDPLTSSDAPVISRFFPRCVLNPFKLQIRGMKTNDAGPALGNTVVLWKLFMTLS